MPAKLKNFYFASSDVSLLSCLQLENPPQKMKIFQRKNVIVTQNVQADLIYQWLPYESVIITSRTAP